MSRTMLLSMSSSEHFSNVGRVDSLHLHSEKPGMSLRNVEEIEVVEGMGIRGNRRYFGRLSYSTGKPSKRQVSLIEREQIVEHTSRLALACIPPGVVQANIETIGINLIKFVGCKVQIGSAILCFYEPRTPCSKMDAICQGLRALMENGRQGVRAQVVQSGLIRSNDSIRPVTVAETHLSD